MNEGRADVLVIGAGVVGLSVAYFAALKGAKVLVLEKGDIGSGSSSGNAGLLVPSYFEPLPAPGIIREALRGLFSSEGFFRIQPRFDPSFLFWLLRFARFCNPRDFEAHSRLLTKLNKEALGIHLDFAARGGESYEFSRKGLLFLYINQSRWEESQRRALRASEFGLETQILSGDEARHGEPAPRRPRPPRIWKRAQPSKVWSLDPAQNRGRQKTQFKMNLAGWIPYSAGLRLLRMFLRWEPVSRFFSARVIVGPLIISPFSFFCSRIILG